MITTLTPEQKALISINREKWKQLALSTEKINREKVIEAVNTVYESIGYSKPEIRFYNSPYGIFKELWSGLERKLESPIGKKVRIELYEKFDERLKKEIANDIYKFLHIETQLPRSLHSQKQLLLIKQICISLDVRMERFRPFIGEPFLLINEACKADYFISVLKCEYNYKLWEAFQSLVKNSGWACFYEKICFISEPPIKVSFNAENVFHAEGTPAIQYADNFCTYVFQGVRLPEYIGKVHPDNWKAQWLLGEINVERKRLLIQGVGYTKICNELKASVIDSWQQYTLLQIFDDIDIEPINLLKMVCPSTNFIHVLRVPPNILSAREAIQWVNWGIDAESFSVQT